jgi:hypothetical protein
MSDEAKYELMRQIRALADVVVVESGGDYRIDVLTVEETSPKFCSMILLTPGPNDKISGPTYFAVQHMIGYGSTIQIAIQKLIAHLEAQYLEPYRRTNQQSIDEYTANLVIAKRVLAEKQHR